MCSQAFCHQKNKKRNGDYGKLKKEHEMSAVIDGLSI
jgi:hypothetical protein